MGLRYSVLMSVYYKENPNHLKKSIESMINQTVKPDEIVIVKDGELTDSLENVILYYSGVYPNLFTVVTLDQNVGLGLALNAGLDVCKNELVARMDADDISLPERCELQLNEFKNDERLSIVGTMIDEFYDDPEHPISSRVVPTSHDKIIKFSKRRNPFNHPTVMYKKTDVLKNGGYKNLRRNQDFDLFVRMINNGCFSMNINKSLVLFRANKSNFSRRKSWYKCKGDIVIAFNFWKDHYIGFFDFIFVTLSRVLAYIMPSRLFEFMSTRFLRHEIKS